MWVEGMQLEVLADCIQDLLAKMRSIVADIEVAVATLQNWRNWDDSLPIFWDFNFSDDFSGQIGVKY